MSGTDHPLASLLLIGFRQQETIAEAIAGALAQTYSPLEIIVSDDASDDETYARMQAAVANYTGPHRIIVNRNPHNLGIGAHLSHVVSLSKGEMLFVAAGDDVSLPDRVERVMAAWMAAGKQPDLIAGQLVDVDAKGQIRGRITPSQLADYRTLNDLQARPPLVIGAAQAWTRRLFDTWGGLPAGVVYEDQIMAYRAVASGGAMTLDVPLVRYRRGGESSKQRSLSAADVSRRLLRGARIALVEIPLLLAVAQRKGDEPAVEAALSTKIQRERYVHDMLSAGSASARLRLFACAAGIPFGVRLRMFVYAAMPWLLAPFFALKRRVKRSG